MKRRDYLKVTIGGAITTGIAGCMDFVAGDGPLELKAGTAVVSDETQEDTGYSEDFTEWDEYEETIEALDQERTVRIENWIAMYDKSFDEVSDEISLGQFAIFVAPKIPLDEFVNPLSEESSEELIQRIMEEGEGGDIDDVKEVDIHSAEFNDGLIEVRKYEATLYDENSGSEQEIYVHISQTETEDDHLLFVGSYPQELDDVEEDNMTSLIESTTYESSQEE